MQMNNNLIIIQARMGSTRLPGKVMMDINGKSMLHRVVERCRKIEAANEIIVATTNNLEDKVIIDECERIGTKYFRGSEEDVLKRYLETSIHFDGDNIIRICSDSPLVDPAVCSRVIESFEESLPNIDFCSNILPHTYPIGLDCQIFKRSALEKSESLALKKYERAHVTAFMYEHPNLFKIKNVTFHKDYSMHRWTVDTPEDMDFVREIYCRLSSYGENFTWKDVLHILEKEPNLNNINKHITQKDITLG